MNDFTKEELEDLLSCCYGGMYDDHPIEDYKIALQRKLQCMIDNYCEHEIMTADMKECQAICTFNEGGKTYFTLTSDIFACGSHASLDMAHKIIAGLCIGENKFQKEWIDKIILRLDELKNDNQ